MGSVHVSCLLTHVVSRSTLAESAATLRALSGDVRESVVLWIGTEQDGKALVQEMVVPRQRASAVHFDVPIEERLRLAQQLAASGQRLLVQLHTHPGRAFHSLADDRLALPRHTGAISIVIANFARGWDGNLRHASVNHHLGGGAWSELRSGAVAELFEVQ